MAFKIVAFVNTQQYEYKLPIYFIYKARLLSIKEQTGSLAKAIAIENTIVYQK